MARKLARRGAEAALGASMIVVVADGTGQGETENEALEVRFASFAHLGCTLEQVTATMVVSPLRGDGFDAMDVAECLLRHGFAGAYRAWARGVPNREAVIAEITAVAPGLDFDLILLDRAPPPA